MTTALQNRVKFTRNFKRPIAATPNGLREIYGEAANAFNLLIALLVFVKKATAWAEQMEKPALLMPTAPTIISALTKKNTHSSHNAKSSELLSNSATLTMNANISISAGMVI